MNNCSANPKEQQAPTPPSARASLRRALPVNAFSLIEIVLALGIIAFAIVALLGLMSAAFSSSRASGADTSIASMARQITADLRSRTFDKFPPLAQESQKLAGELAPGRTYPTKKDPTKPSPTDLAPPPDHTIVYFFDNEVRRLPLRPGETTADTQRAAVYRCEALLWINHAYDSASAVTNLYDLQIDLYDLQTERPPAPGVRPVPPQTIHTSIARYDQVP